MGSGSEAGPQSGFSLDFDPAHRVLRVSGFGVFTMELINQADSALRQFLADEGADFGVFDYSGITEFRVSASEVQSYAERPAPSRPMKLRVAVAPQAEIYGMNRMYEMLIEARRSDFRVVRTMAEAEALIGLGPLNFSRAL